MPAPNLQRLLNARSVAVVGGGWARNVVEQLKKSNYSGQIWPVHPKHSNVLGIPCYASLEELPSAPDAAFLGVNKTQTVELVSQLSNMGAGGAVCFASGFAETSSHGQEQGLDLQAALLKATGFMPILGPNCYGFVNYTNGLSMWPDQHGGVACERGVAIIAQSSNMAINMTMQQRGLPLAYLFTVGNQAWVGVSDLIRSMALDEKVTAIGCYLEGIDHMQRFVDACRLAKEKGKTITVIKVGKSDQSRQASLTHTASLTGSNTANSALFQRLGVAEVDSVEAFIETLKLSHFFGALPSSEIVSVSCSGGEASMMADLGCARGIAYPALQESQKKELNAVLGDEVGLANPLDYHTYIWGDVDKMTACFAAAASGPQALTVFVLDLPRSDLCDPAGHACALESIINARVSTQSRIAVLASLPENIAEHDLQRFIQGGVVPLNGMEAGLDAIKALSRVGSESADKEVLIAPLKHDPEAHVLSEAQAKTLLEQCGVNIPGQWRITSLDQLGGFEKKLAYPLVAKGSGVAHKSEMNAVRLNIDRFDQLEQECRELLTISSEVLIEEMIQDRVMELLVGITVDETGIVLLTLGAGGVMTEIHRDTVSLVLPASDAQILENLNRLRCAPLLHGFRGASATNTENLIENIQAICRYASENIDTLIELDVNPLIVGQSKTVAVDALIREVKLD